MASECTNLRSHSQTAFTVKWAASVIQMLGYAGTGFGWTPWNLYLFLAGVLGWLIVGVLWNDRAIVLIHFVALGAMLWGMASQ
ncbi:MAG: ubiquinone biosynthesis methyltransferase UbiE [Rhodobacteraceae bacterium]|nr:ubiquinone biosynthesis methyltransferase UbiE [Paracoccaceae bacterium]